jgi:hypothetical protein
MPLPNFHSCRVREPGLFKKDSFRTLQTKTKGLSLIVATLKKTEKTVVQAYRYLAKDWGADKSRKHCESRNGRFEAASRNAADHAFFHSIFSIVKKKGEFLGWSLDELVKEHSKTEMKFDPSSELDCLSKIEESLHF